MKQRVYRIYGDQCVCACVAIETVARQRGELGARCC